MSEEDQDITALSAAVMRNKDEHYVVLPCAPSQFGNFVSGLLGKTQTLKGTIQGSVDANYQDIENIFRIVHTRVSDQNEAALAHFSVTVFYDNGTSITHNDVKKFESYSPTDKCHPVEVVLSFIYLVSFPASQNPEKQEIDVSVIAESGYRQDRQTHYHEGAFEYEVNYTNRTWATDIGSLLKNHGEKFVEKPNRASELFRRYHDTALYFASSVIMIFVILHWGAEGIDQTRKATEMTATDSERLFSLYAYLVAGVSIISVLGITLNFIAKYSEYHIFRPRFSHIVLIDQDNKKKNKLKRKEKIGFIQSSVAWVLSIASGLAANFLNASGYFLPT